MSLLCRVVCDSCADIGYCAAFLDANTRLVKAAPDLLAALEDLAALTPRKGIPDRWATALANADAAIAKATGEPRE